MNVKSYIYKICSCDKNVFYVSKDGNKAGCVLLAVCGVLIICIKHLKHNACASVMSTELKKTIPDPILGYRNPEKKKFLKKKKNPPALIFLG